MGVNTNLLTAQASAVGSVNRHAVDYTGQSPALRLLGTLGQHEQRFNFDDRIVVGESVNCLNAHRLLTRFDIDVADSTECHASARVKVVQQAFGRLLAQLLLNHPEQVGVHWLELEMSPVLDAAVALCFFCSAALQWLCQQAASLGKRLECTCGDFANRDATRVVGTACPGNHMTAVGDVDGSLVVTTLDSSCSMDRVQFGVQRPTEHVER